MTRPRESALEAYDNARDALSKSGVVRWLHQHREELTDRHQRGRISWKAMAAVMEADNVRDDAGNSPSPETIRRAWYRMRQAEHRTPRTIERMKQSTASIPPVHVSASEPLTASSVEEEKSNRPRFTLAKLRGMETDENSEPAPKTDTRPATPQAVHDPDDVLARAGFRRT